MCMGATDARGPNCQLHSFPYRKVTKFSANLQTSRSKSATCSLEACLGGPRMALELGATQKGSELLPGRMASFRIRMAIGKKSVKSS